MASAGLLSPVVAVLILAGAVFLALDPLQLSPIAFEKDFKVLSVPQPTLQLLAQIPRDEKNTLKNAEIVYGGQIFGPESVLFDSQGRGPYTGVGDGRVVRWEGSEKGWVEFATVIANRFAPVCICILMQRACNSGPRVMHQTCHLRN